MFKLPGMGTYVQNQAPYGTPPSLDEWDETAFSSKNLESVITSYKY